jgi:hypothetical protein
MSRKNPTVNPVSAEMSQELERFAVEKSEAGDLGDIKHTPAMMMTLEQLREEGCTNSIKVDSMIHLIDTGVDTWQLSTLGNSTDLSTLCRMFRLREGPSIAMADMLGKEIVVQHIIAHPAKTKADEQGEVRTFIRWMYVGPDDTVVTGGGPWCVKALNKFLEASGLKLPFDPPIRFIVRDRTTSKGRRIWWLDPVGTWEGKVNGTTK